MTRFATQRPGGLLELIRAVEVDPHRPRLVCYAAGGGRTELSGASLLNWTAKVAGLLGHALGLAVGDLATVRASTGWQVAPVLLGCWWAGLAVTWTDTDAEVAFVDEGDDADADDVFVLSGHPLGAPATEIADHQQDFTSAVLPQPDRLGPAGAEGGQWTAALGPDGPVTAQHLSEIAAGAATELGGGGRSPDRPVLLSTEPWSSPDQVAGTLLATLAADGALVQCAADLPADRLADIAATERVTVSVGADLPGIPRVG